LSAGAELYLGPTAKGRERRGKGEERRREREFVLCPMKKKEKSSPMGVA